MLCCVYQYCQISREGKSIRTSNRLLVVGTLLRYAYEMNVWARILFCQVLKRFKAKGFGTIDIVN